MFVRNALYACLGLLLPISMGAQTPAPPTPKPATESRIEKPLDETPVAKLPAEAPADAYLRAMQPVEIVRRSPNNITDAEMAAWGVAVVTAAHDCAARKLEENTGEDLFHFARLCQLGQQYEDAWVAARQYIKSGNTQSAESARGLILRSSLSAGNLLRAEQAAYDLLHNHPYDGTVHTLVQEAIMALAASAAGENAMRLLEERQNSLLAALRAGGGLALHEGSYRVPQSALVRDALTAVYLYRAENNPRMDGKSRTLLASVRQVVADSATTVSPMERDAMQAALRRADLLGADASQITVQAVPATKPVRPLPKIQYDNSITVLAFYAPWSPQRGPMFDLLSNLARDYKIFPVQFYAVTTPHVATGDTASDPSEVLSLAMQQFEKKPNPVPVMVAADSTNADFALDDWPMFAVIDGKGKIRFLDTLQGSEYKNGGRMHRLVAALASEAGPLPAPPAEKVKARRLYVPAERLERRRK